MIFIVTEFTCTEFGSVLCVQVVTELKDRHTATATQLPTAATGTHCTTLEHSVSYTTMMHGRELLLLCT